MSGGLVALGLSPAVALLVWKPVAVGSAFIAVRELVHRLLHTRAQRRAALVLGLLFVGFGRLFDVEGLQWLFITEESWLGYIAWGYSFGLISLAALIAALLLYARDREAARTTVWPAVLGALASWLHPWQGEILIALIVGAEALFWIVSRVRPRAGPLLAAAVGTALPLAYYGILERADENWHLAGQATTSTWSLWIVLATLAPLLVPAAIAYAKWPLSFLEASVRIWPLAALVIALVSGALEIGGFALHALIGITVPLAVLAVEGIARVSSGLRIPAPALVATLVVAALVVPTVVDQLTWSRSLLSRAAGQTAASGANSPSFIDEGERRALDYLEHEPRDGAVLARHYLGLVVPSATGRSTYVGHVSWTPNVLVREAMVRELLFGPMTAAVSRDFVASTRARFLLADCSVTRDLESLLGPSIAATRRFGCARVYLLR
jgi:hypothetical protein